MPRCMGPRADPRALPFCHLDGGQHGQLQGLDLHPQSEPFHIDRVLRLLQHLLGHWVGEQGQYLGSLPASLPRFPGAHHWGHQR